MNVRFIRDDGEKLALTLADGFVEKSTDDYLPAKSLRTSMFTYSGDDGGQMVDQNYDPWEITFAGFLKRTRANEVWAIRQKFMTFFAKRHNFTAVFKRSDGVTMAILKGWVSSAPQVTLSGKLDHVQNYSVTLTFGDPYLYAYKEDENGDQVYSDTITVPKYDDSEGDQGYASSAGGYVYYGGGYVYIGAKVMIPVFTIDSIRDINPVWRVTGQASNPKITNLTNNKALQYDGTIPAGQELVVDCQNQIAMIGTADVTRFMSGEWLTLDIGQNKIRYDTTEANDTTSSTLEWNRVLG